MTDGEMWVPDDYGGLKSDHLMLNVKDPDGWHSAQVKFDGCVHFYRYYNLPYPRDPDDEGELEDYLHICDIDDMIARLHSLKRAALAHFGEEWPD